MVTPYEEFMAGAALSKEAAEGWMNEARKAKERGDERFSLRCLSQAEEAAIRAEWCETRAAWYAPKHEQKDIAA